MMLIIYSLQCFVVFGVPALFGWVLLRRLFREVSLVALIPGAIIAGLAALMATINELRFFFEMRLAVWTAYKFLLLATLGMAVGLTPRAARPRLPGCLQHPWQIALLVLGVGGVTVYFGLPAHGGFLNDAWWHHYPSAVEIQTTERFPLNHVFALDSPLYYHHGPDIIAATWSFLLEIPVQKAWALYVTVLAPCSFLLAFALLARLTRNYWSCLLGAAILVGGGNLRFLSFLTHDFTGALGALNLLNSQTVQSLLQLMFTPSHALGVPLVLLLLLLFRHLTLRPGWLLAAGFGLLLATLTLVAEWYFLPLTAGITLASLYQLRNRKKFRSLGCNVLIALIPGMIVMGWGTFNNTYLAGLFGHFWLRYDQVETVSHARQIRLPQDGIGKSWEIAVPSAGAPFVPLIFPSTPPPAFYQPEWTAPPIVPLRLNLTHFGQVPSWESAASAEDSFISILSFRFLSEASPVLLVGLPAALWLAWRRRRQPVVLVLAWLAVGCAMPPVFLDWGYRSTDFLRFFTASYSFSALFTGWLAGELLCRPGLRARITGASLALGCLIVPAAMGLIGLLPGTITKVNAISAGAQSLSQAAAADAKSDPLAPPVSTHSRALEILAIKAGDYLFPLTRGRDRAIVIVPPDQIPKTKYFPEWMKLATLSRLLLPVGWHWENSVYSAYYRDAAAKLDARAIASLEARWIIVSDLFQDQLPLPVVLALNDPARFAPITQFAESGYHLRIYRVLP